MILLPSQGKSGTYNVVSLKETVYSELCESFSPFVNNMDYDDGTNRWGTFVSDFYNCSFFDYKRYGLRTQITSNTTVSKSIIVALANTVSSYFMDDLLFGINVKDQSVKNTVAQWSKYVKVMFDTGGDDNITITFLYNYIADTISCRVEATFNSIMEINTLVDITDTVIKQSTKDGSFRINFAWSKSTFENPAIGSYNMIVYLNGYPVLFENSLDDLETWLSVVEPIIEIGVAKVGATVETVNHIFSIKDCATLPLIHYGTDGVAIGDGTVIPNEIAISDLLDTDYAKSINDYGIDPYCDFLKNQYTNVSLSLALKQRDFPCVFPAFAKNIEAPYTREDFVFEHVYPDRLYAGFQDESSVIMVDKSFDVGFGYLASGAVYGAAGDEYGIDFGQILPTTTINRQAVDNQISMRHFTRWPAMEDGSGDSGKISNDGQWNIYLSRNKRESSAKMLTEESYAGFLAKYSENDGWPISSNRCPTDFMPFYADNGTGDEVLTASTFKNFRFASCNGDNRHMALFAALKDSNAPTGTGTSEDPYVWNNMHVVFGRVENNGKVDKSMTFGYLGYTAIANINSVQMRHLPHMLGNTDPKYAQYPDLAIVPIGDPKTTTNFRIYYITQSSVSSTDYAYDIAYTNVTSAGVVGTSGFVGFNYQPYNCYKNCTTANRYKNTPLQFDVVQPKDGVFIFSILMGCNTDDQGTGTTVDRDSMCNIFISNDGINLDEGSPFVSYELMSKSNLTLDEVDMVYSFGFPSLSYNINDSSCEILLSLTNIYDVALMPIRSAVYSGRVYGNDWSMIKNTKNWNLIFDCNEMVAENKIDITNIKTLGSSAFRDNYGKLHVAVNKISDYDFSYWGAIYYFVVDQTNASNGMNSNSAGYTDAKMLNGDVVSFAKLFLNNKALDDADTYNNTCMLRPKFSPIRYDCYFTVNMQSLEVPEYGYAYRANDPVFRLFEQTTLGELFPPSAAWHVAEGYPVNIDAPAHNEYVWRRVSGDATYPHLRRDGLYWGDGDVCAESYYYYRNSLSYDRRLNRSVIAVKTRFHISEEIGSPVDVNKPLFGINIVNCWGKAVSDNTKYGYVEDLYVYFNVATVTVVQDGSQKFNLTGLDFSDDRDIFVIIKNSPIDNKCYMNIFIEKIFADGLERWQPKVWLQINSTPIELDNTLEVSLASPDIFGFGGYCQDSGQVFDADEMAVKYFTVYEQFFKEVGNQFLSNSVSGNKISSYEAGRCIISGATAGLANRTPTFDPDSMVQMNPAVFQTSQGKVGIDFPDTFVGNNTMLSVTGSNDFSTGNNSMNFGYKFIYGVSNMFDEVVNTYFMCMNNLDDVTICFDSNDFATALSKFAANSIWLKNTNLINITLMASNSANAWGTPTWAKDISFIVDGGFAWAVYGTPGTDTTLTIEDPTKNWIPNQFVDVDNPYYVINGDKSLEYYGGKIVKNTTTKIYYQLSLMSDGFAHYDDIEANQTYRIVAPSVFDIFDLQEYRYWAINIKPSDLFNYYCEGIARIGEFRLGIRIDLENYGDIDGITCNYVNDGDMTKFDDGNLSFESTYVTKEFDIKLTNVGPEAKNKIEDIFDAAKRSNIPVWFAHSQIESNDIGLYDFVDQSLNYTIIQCNYLDEGEEYNDAYNVSFKLRERK